MNIISLPWSTKAWLLIEIGVSSGGADKRSIIFLTIHLFPLGFINQPLLFFFKCPGLRLVCQGCTIPKGPPWFDRQLFLTLTWQDLIGRKRTEMRVTFSWIRGFLCGVAIGRVYGTLMLYCCGQTIDFSCFEFQWKCREIPFGMELVEDKRLFNKLRGLTGYQSRSWIPLGFGGDVARGSETLTGD